MKRSCPCLMTVTACLAASHFALGCGPAPRVEPTIRTSNHHSPALAASDSAGDLSEQIEIYSNDAADVSRFYNVTWSETRHDRLQSLYESRLKQLGSIDFDALSQHGKVDYLLLRNHIRNSLAYNRLDRVRLAEMDPVLPFRKAICGLEEQRWRMERIVASDAAAVIAAIPAQVKTIRERIEKGRSAEKPSGGNAADKPASEASAVPPAADDSPIWLTPVVAQRTSSAVESLRGTLRWWYDYHAQFVPEFDWWLKAPMEEAERSLHEYAEYLRKEIAGLKGEDTDPLIGDPIGRETLLTDLKNEMIAYSPEELISIGETDFAWCESEMKRAAAEMGFGDDWRKALDKVMSNSVPPGEQTHYVTQLVREQVDWLRTNDLITLPDLTTELWRLEMITPDRQKFWPFQYYGGLHIGVAYASEHQTHDAKMQAMRGNNRHFTRLVVPHELIPGHHLQGQMSERHRPYRRLFTTPFFLEGWCLYWEMKHWDMGWAKSPEDRIGMLFWRMHRGARIIVSLKFHLGQMNPPEMIDFLVTRVGHDRNNATSEVRRYIGGDYSPLYQAGYLLGGIQVRALHREAVVKGGMKEREFNDRILTLGTIPVELIRATVLNIPLSRDHEAVWQFGEDNEDR